MVESFTYKTDLPLIDTHSKIINEIPHSKTYSYDSFGRISNETFNDFTFLEYGFTHGDRNG